MKSCRVPIEAVILSLFIALEGESTREYTFQYLAGGGYKVKYCIHGNLSISYDAKSLNENDNFFKCYRTDYTCGPDRFYSCDLPCGYAEPRFSLHGKFRQTQVISLPKFRLVEKLQYRNGEEIIVRASQNVSTIFKDDVTFVIVGPGPASCSRVQVSHFFIACTLSLYQIKTGNFTVSITYGNASCTKVQALGIVSLIKSGKEKRVNRILIILLSLFALLLVVALLIAYWYFAIYRKRSVRPILMEESRPDETSQRTEQCKIEQPQCPDNTEKN